MSFADLPLDLVLRIALASADYHVYAALSLAESRLGRALIQTSSFNPRAAVRAAFCEKTYIITQRGLAVVTRLAGQLHSFDDAPSVDGRWQMQQPLGVPGQPLLICGADFEDEAPYFENGSQQWHCHGRLHRSNSNDQPAVRCANGDCLWFQHGTQHRDGDRPSTEYINGAQVWYQHGQVHRNGDDQPAAIMASGRRREWFQHGIRTRIGDRPAVEHDGIMRVWFKKGILHRDKGKPAIMYDDGEQHWYVHGRRHRVGNQPAIHRTTFEAHYHNDQWVPQPVVRRSARLATSHIDTPAKRSKQ